MRDLTDDADALARAEVADHFLSRLIPPGTPGYRAIASIHPTKKKQDGQPVWEHKHFRCSDSAAAAALAVELDFEQRAVYHTLVIHEEDLGPFRRGGRVDATGIPGFWIDIDYQDGRAHKSKNLPPMQADCIALLDEVGFEPTWLVDSGYGIHAYFNFTGGPLLFGPDVDREDVRRVFKLFQKRVIDAGAAKGWHVDNTTSFAQVLKIPGTRNWKVPAEPREIAWLLDGDAPTSTFAEWKQRLVRAPGRPAKAPPSSGSSPAPANASKASKTSQGFNERPETAALREKLLTYNGGDSGDPTIRTAKITEIKKLSRGESFADDERDKAMQRVVSTVLYFDKTATEKEDLWEVFRPSMQVWADEGPDAKTVDQEMAKVWDKLDRAYDDLVEDLRKEADAEAVVMREKRYDARNRYNRAMGLQVQAPPEPLDEGEAPPPASEDDGRYTPEDMKGFADQQGCTTEEFRKRWIIMGGECYWVYAGGYKKAVRASSLLVAARDDLRPAPVKLTVPKAKGNGDRNKTLPELIYDYATVARNQKADMRAQFSHYDAATDTFYEAVCPRRPLDPVFDPEIDRWLDLMFASNPDLGKDWIATVTRLDSASSALYISGPADAGKSLLGKGLARIWVQGPPTKLVQVLGGEGHNFNADLARCPLVLADEKLPKDSANLREFISETVRPLTRKFIDNMDLLGGVRVVMCANNDHMLELADTDLGPDDLHAVSLRFTHFECDMRPVEYLKSIGGRAKIDAWIEGDGIAKHALWLVQNRASRVNESQRFIVTGEVTTMHRNLVTRDKNASGCCEFIASYLKDPQLLPSIAQQKLIIFGNGELLVNTTAISRHYTLFVASARIAIPTQSITRALENLSLPGGPVIRNGITYHNIDPSFPLEWAARNQVGDVTVLKAKIDAPTPLLAIVPPASGTPPPNSGAASPPTPPPALAVVPSVQSAPPVTLASVLTKLQNPSGT